MRAAASLTTDEVVFTNAVAITVELPADAPARIGALTPAGRADSASGTRLQPLVELMVLGDGHSLSNTRTTHTGVGSRLRVVDHAIVELSGARQLRIRQADAVSGLEVVSVLHAIDGVAAVRSWTEVTNRSDDDVILQMISSFATGTVLVGGERAADVSLLRGRSEWCGENRWAWTPLHGADGLPDINTAFHEHDSRGTLATVSKSTWSSGEFLPTGFLVNEVTGTTLGWQIEHNGAWRWEVDGRRDGANALGLVVGGPNDLDHQWSARLGAGDAFTSVPISVAVSGDGFEGALAGLTAQRRASRRVNAADASTPVVFNDYMNTLMGDPTTEKLLPLVDAAAEAGAEYFCIDAGWYDDSGDWWPSVGEWKPSTARFPDGGIERVLDHIRSRGMKPGLWLEPEVVGIHSVMAERLPDEAFLQRYGRRIVEHDRFLLDFRHPEVRRHLDTVLDHLIDDLGSRFFKLDYNVTPGAGTDFDTLSVGSGLLGHNRAHLEWLDALVERHPDVVFENCGSGAMRMDYAMMSRLDLQSTSDQQDFRLYATIAAGAPVSLLPEQAGNWAYPQPDMTPEDIGFAMVNGLAGRLYLSGHLDGMDAGQKALVADGVSVFKTIRGDLRQSDPFWPLGLPGWFDDVVSVGFRARDTSYLAVWSRGDSIDRIDVPLDGAGSVDVVYPTALEPWSVEIAEKTLHLTPARPGPSARLFRITH
jgi:alpha-galactosidase